MTFSSDNAWWFIQQRRRHNRWY